MKVFRFNKFNESLDSKNYSEVIEYIKELIEDTVEKSNSDLESFISSFSRDPENVKIEGLINDSDIYEFYLKYRNQIDEILNELKFYDESPSEIQSFGLYDYMIKGTLRSISEFVKMI